MFRFTYEPSLGSHNQYLVIITNLVQVCVSVETLTVLSVTVACTAITLTTYVCVCVCGVCSAD